MKKHGLNNEVTKIILIKRQLTMSMRTELFYYLSYFLNFLFNDIATYFLNDNNLKNTKIQTKTNTERNKNSSSVIGFSRKNSC